MKEDEGLPLSSHERKDNLHRNTNNVTKMLCRFDANKESGGNSAFFYLKPER